MAEPGPSATDEKKLFQALLAGPPEAKITSLAMNVRGKDAKGPYVLTIAMPMTAVEGIVKGTLSDAELQKLLQMGMQRG